MPEYKFIISGFQRTGSTLLKACLNTQPNIFCLKEIFNTRQKHIFNDKLEDYLKLKVIGLKKKFPINFLGFKVFIKQSKNLSKKDKKNFYDFLIKNNIKVVISDRKNCFLQFLSICKAKKSGYMLCKKRISDNSKIYKKLNIKIFFPVKQYQKFKENKEKELNFFIKELERKKIPYLISYYEDRTGDNKNDFYKEIHEFITNTPNNFVPIDFTSQIQLLKQNVYSLKEQIKNFDEVYTKLKDDPCFIDALENEPDDSLRKILENRVKFKKRREHF